MIIEEEDGTHKHTPRSVDDHRHLQIDDDQLTIAQCRLVAVVVHARVDRVAVPFVLRAVCIDCDAFVRDVRSFVQSE